MVGEFPGACPFRFLNFRYFSVLLFSWSPSFPDPHSVGLRKTPGWLVTPPPIRALQAIFWFPLPWTRLIVFCLFSDGLARLLLFFPWPTHVCSPSVFLSLLFPLPPSEATFFATLCTRCCVHVYSCVFADWAGLGFAPLCPLHTCGFFFGHSNLTRTFRRHVKFRSFFVPFPVYPCRFSISVADLISAGLSGLSVPTPPTPPQKTPPPPPHALRLNFPSLFST